MIFDINLDGNVSMKEYSQILGMDMMSDYAKEIKTVFGTIYDDRTDLSIQDRLDQYGQEQPNELKKALINLKRFIVEQCSDMETAYKTIFGEFDKNNDGTLSRDEFLMGLDNYNK